MRSSILLFLFLTALTRLNAQQAGIQINPPIADPDVLAAMEYTTSIWEQHLVSPVPIKVNVLFVPVNGLFLGLTFPTPMLDGFPGVYDRLLVNGSGALLTDTMIFPNSSITLHNAFTTNNVFFAGEESAMSNGDIQPRIFAPPTYTFGVSISHLDEGAFPNSSGNSLMTPYINPGEVEQEPGPLTLAILRDIGWNVTTSVSAVPTPSFPVEIWGLDRHRLIRADLPRAGDLSIRLVDGTGRILYNNVFPDLPAGIQEISLDPVLQTLHSGYYLMQISGLGCMIVKSIILFP